jgi:acyl-CoA thioesterase-2
LPDAQPFTLPELIENLAPEPLDRLLFRGHSLPFGLPRVFGGQVAAQAFSAAARTVPADRHAHSMHAYFLRPGDPGRPILYEVDPIRDGGSFVTRRVVAKQNGEAIFNTAVSFHKREDGLSHQMPMPGGVQGPEGLEADADRIERRLAAEAGAKRPFYLPLDVVDLRTPDPQDPLNPVPSPPEQGFWFRFQEGVPDDPVVHTTLLIFVSDYRLMSTGLMPHGVTWQTRKIMMASLDHVMWFHAPARVDRWLYHHMDSPWSGGARDLSRGSFYEEGGTLVASSAQEGLIRLLD